MCHFNISKITKEKIVYRFAVLKLSLKKIGKYILTFFCGALGSSEL